MKIEKQMKDNLSGSGSLVLASSKVVGPKKQAIRFVYRQEPDNEHDSGWRFFHGDESEEFSDNSENCLVCPLHSFLDMDASLREIITSPVGSVWERYTDDGEWVAVEDYDIQD